MIEGPAPNIDVSHLPNHGFVVKVVVADSEILKLLKIEAVYRRTVHLIIIGRSVLLDMKEFKLRRPPCFPVKFFPST